MKLLKLNFTDCIQSLVIFEFKKVRNYPSTITFETPQVRPGDVRLGCVIVKVKIAN